MNIEIISKPELDEFRQSLIEELKDILDFAFTRTKWIRTAEAKELLSCSAATIKNFRNRNILPYSKLGGSYFYPRHEIDRILDDKLVRPVKTSQENGNVKTIHTKKDRC